MRTIIMIALIILITGCNQQQEVIDELITNLKELQLPTTLKANAEDQEGVFQIEEWKNIVPVQKDIGEMKVYAIGKITPPDQEPFVLYQIHRYYPEDELEEDYYELILVNYQNGISLENELLAVDGLYASAYSYINKEYEITFLYESESEGKNVSYHIKKLIKNSLVEVESDDRDFEPSREGYDKSERFLSQTKKYLKERGNLLSD